MQTLLAILLVLLSLFLILLILIQQGKGGGLAGAFGGMGGQSAFGTKAGDLFTKITIGVAGVWIVLCILLVRVTGSAQSGFSSSGSVLNTFSETMYSMPIRRAPLSLPS